MQECENWLKKEDDHALEKYEYLRCRTKALSSDDRTTNNPEISTLNGTEAKHEETRWRPAPSDKTRAYPYLSLTSRES